MQIKPKTGIRIAGVIGLLFTAFHLYFYVLFKWQQSLACLNKTNWSIFMTYHVASIFFVGTITYFSLFHPTELITTKLGRSLLVVFSIFYLIRLAAEFLFFGFNGVSSLVIVILCLIPTVIYAWVALMKRKR